MRWSSLEVSALHRFPSFVSWNVYDSQNVLKPSVNHLLEKGRGWEHVNIESERSEPLPDVDFVDDQEYEVTASDTELLSRFELLTNVHMFQWAWYLLFSLVSIQLSIWRVHQGLRALLSYSKWIHTALAVMSILLWSGTGLAGLVFALARQEHILGTLDDDATPFQVYATVSWCIYALLLETVLHCGFMGYVLGLALKKDKHFQQENPHLDPSPQWYTRQGYIHKLKHLIGFVLVSALLSISMWCCLGFTTDIKVKLALYVCGMSLSTPIYFLKAVFQYLADDVFEAAYSCQYSFEKWEHSLEAPQASAYANLFVQSHQVSNFESTLSQTCHESNPMDPIKSPLEAPKVPPRLHQTKSIKAISMILGTYEPYKEPTPSEHTVPFVYSDMYSQVPSDHNTIPDKSYILGELGSYATNQRKLYL
jgi:hypothetical protein